MGENKKRREETGTGLPAKGEFVWVDDGGETTKWSVMSRKDKDPKGGNFNCKNINSGKTKSLNFNKIKWGYLNDSSEYSDMSVPGAGGGETSDGSIKTPPTRTSTPVENYQKTPGHHLKQNKLFNPKTWGLKNV